MELIKNIYTQYCREYYVLNKFMFRKYVVGEYNLWKKKKENCVKQY